MLALGIPTDMVYCYMLAMGIPRAMVYCYMLAMGIPRAMVYCNAMGIPRAMVYCNAGYEIVKFRRKCESCGIKIARVNSIC